MADIDIAGRNGQTPIQLLQSQLVKSPDDFELVEMIELLAAQRKHWKLYGCCAVMSQLGVYGKLVPDLADMIVSFIDG